MITRDIWNPWHGCTKVSEGCDHCYMYFLDRMRGQDGSRIRRSKTGFDLPLKKDRHGDYKIHSGEKIRVCMNSDFFLKEADPWRQQAWDIMRRRSDVIFFLLTKRPERVPECLPPDWRQGWENITLYVTAGYVHTLENTSKIKENRHSKPLKYAILYAKFFENP